MSRPTRRTRTLAARESVPPTRRPPVVWGVYALGLLAGAVLAFSILFSLGGYLATEDVAIDVSPLALVLWLGLVALAAGTWLRRRRASRR